MFRPSESVFMINTITRYFLLLFLILPWNGTRGQKLIPDTLFVTFRGDSLIRLNNFTINEIEDYRDENPHFVRYTTDKKYLLVPVDVEVYTKDSLARELFDWLSGYNDGRNEYSLDIDQFSIEERKGKLSKSLYLVADLRISENIRDSTFHLGTFYYDFRYLPGKRKETLTESTEKLLSDWSREFKVDLLTMNSTNPDASPETATNFIPDPGVKSLYLNTQAAMFIGLGWYGFQGEIFFTRPETDYSSNYSSGIVRYQKNKDYQSFAIGRKATHTVWRRNEKIIFDVDLNILMGFCKWNDMELSQPKLYQLFDLEISSVQSIMYDPLNRGGILLRGGLIENFSYIVGKTPKFQAGLFIGIGVKI